MRLSMTVCALTTDMISTLLRCECVMMENAAFQTEDWSPRWATRRHCNHRTLYAIK